MLDERRWTWYHGGQGRLPRGLDGKVGQQVDVKWPLLARTGGGYFFIWVPREIAAITSISSAIVSVTLIGVSSFRSWPPPLLNLCYIIFFPFFQPLST